MSLVDAAHSHRGLVRRLLAKTEPRDKAESIFRTLTVYKARVRLDDEQFAFSDLWSPKTLASLQKEEPLVHMWLDQHQQFVIHGKPLIWWSRGILNRSQVDDRAFGKAARLFYHASHDEGISLNKRTKDLTAAVTRALKDGLRLMETSEGMDGAGRIPQHSTVTIYSFFRDAPCRSFSGPLEDKKATTRV